MPTKRDFTAIGVDVCTGGWFYVRISPEGEFSAGVVTDLASLMDSNEAQRVLVDIPIGLPTKPGGRRCDTEGQGSSRWVEVIRLSGARSCGSGRREL